MKSISKKLVLTLFSAVFAVCCLFFAATSVNNKVQVNADAAALEAEFTNNGEFTISKSAWNNTLTYIDGTTVGGTGAVLQVAQNAAVNMFRLDLTPMKVTKADVTSIVVKLKAANFTLGSDEFRTSSNAGAPWIQYGKTDDLSDWFSYTLNANSMADFTVNSDGTMGYSDIGIRTNTASLIMYVDSVTVTVRDTSGMELQNYNGIYSNASYNTLTRALLTYKGTASWNDSDDGNLKYKITLKNSSTGASVLYANCGSSISHWGGQKWISIALPGTYDTMIIGEGAHFAGVKVPAMTLVFDTAWVFAEKYEDLNFVSIDSTFNNDGNGFFIFMFDTIAWTGNATPTNITGFNYNGNALSDLTTNVKFFGTSSLWLTYTKQANNPKLAADYNNYSHPTIEIEEGASFEYGGHTYTFHAVTFYLNLSTNKWQTTMPDGYYDHIDLEEAVFSGVWGSANEYNSSTTLLLQYTSTATWDHTDKGTIASKITYRNSSTSASTSPTNSDIAGWGGQKWIVLNGLSGYDVIEIAEGGTFGGVVEIPAGTFYLVNGRWVNTAPHAANTNYSAIASGWNNLSSSGSSCNVLRFDVNPLGAATSATNLAATLSRTSLMVKYNGSTFFDLYSNTKNANRTKYKIDYEHGNGYFYFTIPEADLVDGAAFEIEAGTPFMNYYLGGVTLEYNATAGEWQLPVNYTPSFVSINNGFNNDSNGFFVAQFNTTGWAQNGLPTSYSGITYNGNSITDLTSNIKFFQEHSVWFTYTVQTSNPKLVANYNGYSHPTIAFAEGATMVYDGKTYTFHAVTFYLNLSTNKWQTEVPAGYYDHIDTAVFSGVWGNANAYNSSTTLLLQYTTTGAWDYTNKGTLASHITYRNSSTSATFSPTDSNIAGWDGNKWIVLNGLTGYDVIEIAAGGMFGGGNEIPAGTFYLVNGRWVDTVPHASNTVFTTIHSTWNNYAAGDSTSGTILTYNVNPLGAAASGTNLASTISRTSLMVKYNGSTFFDLYMDTTNANRTKYKISYEHGNGHFYFTVPEADLVDGATLEVEDGTPFMNYYLEGVTITYNASSGKWQVPVNYNPSFVSISDSWNNNDSGYFIAQFNTTGWEQSGVPTSYSGITYNGNSITDLTTNIKFFQEHSVWFTYTPQASNPKLAANYNGYSHPTIAFAEGATMVYGGETYTFHAVTFYLNLSTNKWQTAVPDGYVVRNALNYSSVNASYNNNKSLASGYSCTLIQFSGTIGSYTGTNIASTLGAYITIGGETLDNISGAVLQIGYNSSYTNCLFVKVPVSALVIDGTSKVVELSIADYITGDAILFGVDLYLVDGVWVTSYSATIRTYVQERWGCWDYTDGYALKSNLPTDDVFALLDYGASFFDGAETTVYTNYITALNDVGNKIKINGTTPLKDEPLARVYLVNAHMVIAVPSCEYVTIDEGTYFLGNLLGAATMYYNGYFWESSPTTPTSVTLTELTWNNFDYNGYGMTLGYENNTGIPSNGMAALLKFNTNLTSSGERVSSANQVTEYSKIGYIPKTIIKNYMIGVMNTVVS